MFLLAALALGAAPRGAQATTAPPLTLTQQAKKADVIIRATLGTPSTVKDGEVTWLVYPLTVTETVAGDPASLPQLDGKPALYLLSGVEGLPDLRAGQDAFLLLYSKRLDSPIVGFAQGLYPVENGKVLRTGTDPGAPTEAPTPPTAPTTTGSATTSTGTASSPATGAGTTAGANAGTAAPGPTPSAATPGVPTAAPSSTTTAGSAAIPSTPTSGTATTPASATGTASSTTPTTSTPGLPGTRAATAPASGDPNAIPSDPAKFRDALIAARGAK